MEIYMYVYTHTQKKVLSPYLGKDNTESLAEGRINPTPTAPFPHQAPFPHHKPSCCCPFCACMNSMNILERGVPPHLEISFRKVIAALG